MICSKVQTELLRLWLCNSISGEAFPDFPLSPNSRMDYLNSWLANYLNETTLENSGMPGRLTGEGECIPAPICYRPRRRSCSWTSSIW